MIQNKIINVAEKMVPNWAKKIGRPIYTPLFQELEWRRLEKLYKKFVKSGDLVFDIGGHQGNMTATLAKIGARVVCIEPRPSGAKQLKERFRKEHEITIVQKGVGEKKGMLPLFVHDKDTSTSSFAEKWKTEQYNDGKWNKTINVSITTIDELIKEFGKPTFCKIDVEGFEVEVLKGLNSKIPLISFEFHKNFEDAIRKCIERLEKIDEVEFNFSLYGNHKFELKKWVKGEDIIKKINKINGKNVCGDIYAKFKEKNN